MRPVPRQVEVEQIRTMRFGSSGLSGCVGREQNAQRVFAGSVLNLALDLLAVRAAGKAVDHLDALIGAVGTLSAVRALLQVRFVPRDFP